MRNFLIKLFGTVFAIASVVCVLLGIYTIGIGINYGDLFLVIIGFLYFALFVFIQRLLMELPKPKHRVKPVTKRKRKPIPKGWDYV